jgi:peptide/nickel transport system substrate-binding protein
MTAQEEGPAHRDEPGRHTRGEFLHGALATGAAVGAGALLDACGGTSSSKTTATMTTSSPTTASQALRHGGSLTIGLGAGSTADTLSPWISFSTADAARQFCLYDSLTQIRGSISALTVENRIVDELTPNKDATVWTFRLKSGVEFHNGKTLDVNDLIYTIDQITNPKVGAENIGRFLVYDMKNAKKLDNLTLRVPMLAPVSIIPELVGDGSIVNIVPVGFDVKHPVGTGPFKLVSFTPGQDTVFARHPNYWGPAAKVDILRLSELPDDTARYNALLSGQIDVIDIVPYSLISQLESNPSFHVSNLQCGQFNPMFMRVDVPPFTDVRVRQAMRLAVDRQQVNASAYSNAASHGSDLFGLNDPVLDTTLVRNQDIEQAKALLKQAGKENLTVTMTVAPISPGALEQCQALAASVKAAGITVNLRQVDSGTLYGSNYLNWPFSVDSWPGLNYLVLIATNDGPNAHIDESHFDNPRFNTLYKQALATLDPAMRTEIAHEMQMIEFNEGGISSPPSQTTRRLTPPR